MLHIMTAPSSPPITILAPSQLHFCTIYLLHILTARSSSPVTILAPSQLHDYSPYWLHILTASSSPPVTIIAPSQLHYYSPYWLHILTASSSPKVTMPAPSQINYYSILLRTCSISWLLHPLLQSLFLLHPNSSAQPDRLLWRKSTLKLEKVQCIVCYFHFLWCSSYTLYYNIWDMQSGLESGMGFWEMEAAQDDPPSPPAAAG